MKNLSLFSRKNLLSFLVKKAWLSVKPTLPYQWMAGSGDKVVHLGVWKIETLKAWSRAVGSEGRLLAIEALPENVKLLQFECRRRTLSNIDLVNKAVWYEKTKIPFQVHVGTWSKNWEGEKQLNASQRHMHSRPAANSTFIDEYTPEHDVLYENVVMDADKLENILSACGMKEPDHVHITVTGAEWEILQGLDRLLQQKGISFMVSSSFLVKETREPGWMRTARFFKKHGFKVIQGKKMQSRHGGYVYACLQ